MSEDNHDKNSQTASVSLAFASVEATPGGITMSHYSHQGPLPDPTTLALYRQIDPRIVETVLLLAQSNQANLEKQLNASVAFDRRAQWFTFTIFVLILALLAFAVYRNEALAPFAGIFVAIAAVGLAFFGVRSHLK